MFGYVCACVCNRSQCNVVVKYLKVVHWSRGWGLGLGWGPAQSTIWNLRSCQTTTHTHTDTHKQAHTILCVCQTTQGAGGPRGLRWWAGAAAVQTTHTPYTPKKCTYTHVSSGSLKKCTASYLNHTLTPTRHTHTLSHTSAPPPHSSAHHSVNKEQKRHEDGGRRNI